MDGKKIEQGKIVAKKILIGLYLLAILIPLILRIAKAKEIDGVSITLIIALFLPGILMLLIKLIKMLSENRSELDLPSDHMKGTDILSGVSIKFILLGFGFLIGAGLLILFVPTPWNLFIILITAYGIFASIRLLY